MRSQNHPHRDAPRLALELCTQVEPLYCALSGDEIVWALRHAGFRTTSLDATSAALERARARVVVPRGRLLDGQELRAILRAAGVSYLEVLDLLDGARAIAI